MARHIRTLTRNKQVTIKDDTDKKKKLVFEIRGLSGADSLTTLEDSRKQNQAEVMKKTVLAGVVRIVSGITKSDTDNSIPDLKDFDLITALTFTEIADLFVEIITHSAVHINEKKTS